MENKNFHILSQEIIKTKAHRDNYLALNEMVVLSSTTLLANITKQKKFQKESTKRRCYRTSGGSFILKRHKRKHQTKLCV